MLKVFSALFLMVSFIAHADYGDQLRYEQAMRDQQFQMQMQEMRAQQAVYQQQQMYAEQMRQLQNQQTVCRPQYDGTVICGSY